MKTIFSETEQSSFEHIIIIIIIIVFINFCSRSNTQYLKDEIYIWFHVVFSIHSMSLSYDMIMQIEISMHVSFQSLLCFSKKYYYKSGFIKHYLKGEIYVWVDEFLFSRKHPTIASNCIVQLLKENISQIYRLILLLKQFPDTGRSSIN